MHIMLLGLTHPLLAGQSFPLTLHFEKAGMREVTVAVAKVGAMGLEKAAGTGMPMPAGR
jgi:copper(I)-binding protein